MELQEFKDKITEVGAILKMQVEFAKDEDMRWNKRAYLKKAQQKIGISRNGGYQNTDKLHIFVDFPRTEKREMVHYGESPSINVSETKTPEQIARDIERRLLPAYLPELEKALAQVEQINSRDQKRQANTQKMADYFGVAPQNDREQTIYVYDKIKGLGYKIAATEDTVKFELEISPEMAIKIFDLLKEAL